MTVSRPTFKHFAVGALVALTLAGVSLARQSAAAAPAKQRPLRLRETCVTPLERAGVVRLLTADKTRLLGVMIGRGPRTVVLGHQLYSSLCEWLPYARTLAAKGFSVLLLDFRGHGSSGFGVRARGSRLDLDLRAAVTELRRRGAESVVLVGASMGGTAAMVAAASIVPTVQGAVSLSGPVTYGLLSADVAVARMSVPVLFEVAENDYPEQSQILFDLAASQDKRLIVVPPVEPAHGTALLQVPEARAALDAFIENHSS